MFKNLGGLILCLAVAALGFIYKNDPLAKNEFDSFLTNSL